MKSDIKAYKKEIIVVSIYLLVFGALYFFINNLQTDYDELKNSKSSIEYTYNRIRNNKFTMQQLTEKITETEKEIEIAKEKLPSELTVQEMNKRVLELANKSNGLFTFKNCKIGTTPTEDKNNNVKYYVVSVDKVSGTYTQYKDFLNLVSENQEKIKVSMSRIKKEANDQISGNMTILFYCS